MRTFAGPAGPSSFDICSLACLGRSTVFVRGRRPKRNDMFVVDTMPQLSAQMFRVALRSWRTDIRKDSLCGLAIKSDIRKSKACARGMARSRGSGCRVGKLMRRSVAPWLLPPNVSSRRIDRTAPVCQACLQANTKSRLPGPGNQIPAQLPPTREPVEILVSMGELEHVREILLLLGMHST